MDLLDRMFVPGLVARPAVCDERGLRWVGQRGASHIARTSRAGE
jgi:hypothetical protein